MDPSYNQPDMTPQTSTPTKIYYVDTDLSKIKQINVSGKTVNVINFSFIMVNDQQTLVVVYKNEDGTINVLPVDSELIMDAVSMMGGKNKKSKKSKL